MLQGQTPGEAGAEVTGWEFTGFPALNFDSDEGLGYGAVMVAYDYGPGGLRPYRMAFLPAVLFTTEGRKNLTLFFDSPHLLPGGWRIDAFGGVEEQIATPYYGIGNETAYRPELEEGNDPHFYRFGQEMTILEANLQHPLGQYPVRFLVGAKWADFSIDATPEDEGTTLLLQEMGEAAARAGGTQSSVRMGLIWDTRDRESGPTRGVWTEALVEKAAELMGSDHTFTRWTLTDRRYFSLGSRLVFANRVLVQDITGDPPFHALSSIQSSFGGAEGLGGGTTVRGLLRNRFVGEGIFVWNAELRWWVTEYSLLDREGHVALTAFLDSGRVWAEGLEPDSLFSGLHHGYGGGLRLGLGPNFVLALDLASSREVGLQTYTGLGYLF